MDIQFNGAVRSIPEETTVEQLLEQIGVQARYCAVEVNLEIVPREEFARQQLKADDCVEVVTLVGGG